MQKIIGVTELQRHFRDVFEEVAEEQIPYVLTRGSRPEAVLISYAEFLRYQALQERDILAQFDRLQERMRQQNAAFSEEEVDADITDARNELAV